MNKASNSSHSFTRGGQIILHNLRMWTQVANQILLFSLVFFITLTAFWGYLKTTAQERYVTYEYVWGHLLIPLDQNAQLHFKPPYGTPIKVKYRQFIQSKSIKRIVASTIIKLEQSLLLSLMFTMIAIAIVCVYLKRKGRIQSQHQLIKGDRIATREETARLIRKDGQRSHLHLAKLSLIKHKETAHFLFHGTTGTGKSNAIKELLDQIRANGDKAIIYDKSCNFLEEFYLPKSDLLLNPLDKRTAAWNLWEECRDAADFDNLAAAQIPLPSNEQDPFWINAARMIFSTSAFEMRNDPNKSVFKLLYYLLSAEFEVLEKYLKGTLAETLVSRKTEKTAVNIKSILATYLKSLKYIKEDKHSFSIRKWVQNDHEKNWLFITSLGDRHETLTPLITAWLDIAVNSILSLKPDPTRRIWLILDELTSLQPLPYLTQCLAESRKFGGCIVLGLQNYAQLQKRYGINGAKEISSLLNTRFLFRQPDPEMAKWSAENFGETIVEEVHEGVSYGANSMRDGISINRVETRKPLISFAEILSLADLYAYVRLPGQFPVSKVQFDYKKRPSENAGFIMRDIDHKKIEIFDDLPRVDKNQSDIKSPMSEKKR